MPAPTAENLLLCDRGNVKGSTAPCASDPKVGYGFVMAYRGAPLTNDVSKLTANTLGFAFGIFGYSATAFAKGAAPSNAIQWN